MAVDFQRYTATVITPERMRPRYIYEYYVSGRGEFPFDMLRYDECWPVSGEDAVSMAIDFGDPERRKTRSIRLRSYKEPTVGRWSSFVWSVGVNKI